MERSGCRIPEPRLPESCARSGARSESQAGTCGVDARNFEYGGKNVRIYNSLKMRDVKLEYTVSILYGAHWRTSERQIAAQARPRDRARRAHALFPQRGQPGARARRPAAHVDGPHGQDA